MKIAYRIDGAEEVKSMAFSVEPGPLPLWTVRDSQKWGNRLGETVELHGDGCLFPPRLAQIIKVAGADGLRNPYPTGTSVIALWLEAAAGHWINFCEMWFQRKA